MERLDKLLSGTGRWSRREVKELVKQGRVTVDGVTAIRADEKYSLQSEVMVDDEKVCLERDVYLLMNKPAGVLSATVDSNQSTVLDLLPMHLRRIGLAPVGRLDKDTEGLLLLTNDGELAHRLLSPRHHVDKVYEAQIEGTVSGEDIEAFAAGLVLEDGLACLPARLESLGTGRCRVTLQEGKFHQVKRMLAQRGKPVTYLRRISMGPLILDPELVPGQWRQLTETERSDLGVTRRNR